MKKLFFSMLAMFAFASTAMAQGPKFTVEDVIVADGKGTVVVSFEYDKANYYNGFQFDILLPDEITAKVTGNNVKAPELKDADQKPGANIFVVDTENDINYGKKVIRFFSVNTDGYAFPGTSGTISFPITVDATLNEVFEGKLNNGKINPGTRYLDEEEEDVDVVAEQTEYNIPEVTFKVLTGTAVGISEIQQQAEQGPVYNLNGQRVQKAQKGLYIENGKKVVKK